MTENNDIIADFNKLVDSAEIGEWVEFKCYIAFKCITHDNSGNDEKDKILITKSKRMQRWFFKISLDLLTKNAFTGLVFWIHLNKLTKYHFKEYAKELNFDLIDDDINITDNISMRYNTKRKEFNSSKIRKLIDPPDKTVEYKYQYKILYILEGVEDKIKCNADELFYV